MSSVTARPAERLQSDIRADRRCALALVWIVIATPLAILPGRFADYDTAPKLVVLYVASAVLLWSAPRWCSAFASLWATVTGRLLCSLLIVGAACVLISAGLSRDPWLSLAGTVWRRLGALNQAPLFLVAAVVAAHVSAHRGSARKLMLGMEVAGAIASVYAVLQYAGWDPMIPGDLYGRAASMPGAVRPPATLGHATYFATFLLSILFIATGFRIRETTFRKRRIHEAALFVCIMALILSGTRSALLGFGVGILTLTFMERDLMRRRKTLARFAYGASAFAVLLTVFVMLPVGAGIRVRLTQWRADSAGGPRLLVWRDSLPVFMKDPVWGIGPEMFEAEFRKAQSLELARAFPDHYHESPHNFFLEIGLSQGIFGLTSWLALLGLGLWCGLESRWAGDSEATPLLAALLGMVVSLQFCPLTITNELYMLLIVAMLVGLRAQYANSDAHMMRLSQTKTRCAIVCGVALLVLSGAYVLQDVLYAFTEDGISNGDVGRAQHWFELASKLPMPGPNLRISREFASLARRSPPPLRQDALFAATEAAAMAERGSAERFAGLYQSAMLATLNGDSPRAEAKLRAAIVAAPTWYRPRMALASVLWSMGRNQEGDREADMALARAGSVRPEVKRTLDDARMQAVRHYPQ